MRILVTNDDGYNAYGIKILADRLSEYGTVTLAAPKKNKSACSSSLSVHSPVKVEVHSKANYIVSGTPADCIHIVSRGIMSSLPDIVFSGINFGSNLGDDVIYSGTVAGAIEGRFCRYSPIAISVTSRQPKYLDDLSAKIDYVLSYIFKIASKKNIIYNINIPDTPLSSIKGIKYTQLGSRHKSLRPKLMKRGASYIAEIGAVGKPKKTSLNTDFNAIKKNYISITPLTIDMCDKTKIKTGIIK
ncbi:MAG: 5'/3'-nucleotidase SurE [Gammaproteobacteria bacterium]|nr:5'/3'-nucleotidase SurE [Gammaproteobacteria bacterium]